MDQETCRDRLHQYFDNVKYVRAVTDNDTGNVKFQFTLDFSPKERTQQVIQNSYQKKNLMKWAIKYQCNLI